MESGRGPEIDLELRIRRIQQALGRVRGPQARLVREVVEKAGTHVLERVNERLDHHIERESRRTERRRLRQARRRERGVPQGIIFAAASAVMAGMALTQPHLWWLVFPAFAFGMSAARHFSWAARRFPDPAVEQSDVPALEKVPEKTPAVEAPEAETSDPRLAGITTRLARVDSVCDKLLSELKSAPRAILELIRKPEETVEALRAASHELARRERELRRAITEEDDQRLRRERVELEARVAAEGDEVVRARLTGAIEALDAQLAHRAELTTGAARIEAEGTRILYSLENLRAQVLRTWTLDSTSPDIAGEGLRDGLQQLSREMDAAATALEEVHAAEQGRRASPVPQTLRT